MEQNQDLKINCKCCLKNKMVRLCKLVGGRVENPSERAFDEPVGVNFKAGMPKDVVEQLPAHEGTKGKRVNWHERSGEWENPYLNQSLPWVESKGSP